MHGAPPPSASQRSPPRSFTPRFQPLLAVRAGRAGEIRLAGPCRVGGIGVGWVVGLGGAAGRDRAGRGAGVGVEVERAVQGRCRSPARRRQGLGGVRMVRPATAPVVADRQKVSAANRTDWTHRCRRRRRSICSRAFNTSVNASIAAAFIYLLAAGGSSPLDSIFSEHCLPCPCAFGSI